MTNVWVLAGVQVLNGAFAAALFNLLYDVVLSQKVKWYAMCPVVDFLNHKSSVQVRLSPFLPLLPSFPAIFDACHHAQ